jgi:uridine kinase
MFLVGISGGSGSGKTTFVNKILRDLGIATGTHGSVGTLHLDSYYLQSPSTHCSNHGEANFDHPESFDWELVKTHVNALKHGFSVQMPVYDFKTSCRLEQTVTLGPCKAVIVEGIYTLWDSQLRDLFDLKVYLHVDADIRFIRRLHRDVRERGRTLDGIIRQYYDTVRPMHHEYLEPTKQFADLVVGEETDIAASVIAARVQQLLWSPTSRSYHQEVHAI